MAVLFDRSFRLSLSSNKNPIQPASQHAVQQQPVSGKSVTIDLNQNWKSPLRKFHAHGGGGMCLYVKMMKTQREKKPTRQSYPQTHSLHTIKLQGKTKYDEKIEKLTPHWLTMRLWGRKKKNHDNGEDSEKKDEGVEKKGPTDSLYWALSVFMSCGSYDFLPHRMPQLLPGSSENWLTDDFWRRCRWAVLWILLFFRWKKKENEESTGSWKA